MNGSNLTLPTVWDDPWALVPILGHSGLFLVGTAIMLPVLVLLLLIPSLRTVNNAIVFNILLSGQVLLSTLPFIVTTHILGTWRFGGLVCRGVFGGEAVGKMAIILFISLASLERFLLVSHNKALQRHWMLPICIAGLRLRERRIVFSGWGLAISFSVPMFLYSRLELTACHLRFPSPSHLRAFMYFCFCVLFLLPTLLIAISYVAIIRKIRLSRTRLARFSRCSQTGGQQPSRKTRFERMSMKFSRMRGKERREWEEGVGAEAESGVGAKETLFRPRVQSHGRGQSVTRMVLALISCFLVSWCPFWTLNFISVVNPSLIRIPGSAWKIFLNLIHMLPYLGAVANPLLYLLLTDKFRDSWKIWIQRRRPSNTRLSKAREIGESKSVACRRQTGKPKFRPQASSPARFHLL